MSSSRNWVIFDEENLARETKTNLALNNSSVRGSLPIRIDKLEYESSSSDDLRWIFSSQQNLDISKYSVFDSLRRREGNGDYLGWSKEVRGEDEGGWSEEGGKHGLRLAK